jgi:hypothetical protein
MLEVGAFPNWSRDGQYVYFVRWLYNPAVLRVRITDRAVEQVSELWSFPKQPGCLSQYSHGHGPVIRRHSARLAASHKNRSCAQLCGPERSGQTGRTSANDYDID